MLLIDGITSRRDGPLNIDKRAASREMYKTCLCRDPMGNAPRRVLCSA
jgi:hypothetical protein